MMASRLADAGEQAGKQASRGWQRLATRATAGKRAAGWRAVTGNAGNCGQAGWHAGGAGMLFS